MRIPIFRESARSCSGRKSNASCRARGRCPAPCSTRTPISSGCRPATACLRLLMLQREGRRPLTAREFLAGRRIEPGARFLPSRRHVMIAPARTAAFTALRDVNAGRVDLPAALAAVRPTLQDERDRALATDLVTGTLRWQRQLDYLIEHFAKRPLEQARLRGAADSATRRVSTAASRSRARCGSGERCRRDDRRARKTSAAGLVNAVLRGALAKLASGCRCPLRPPEGDPLPYLGSLAVSSGLARRSLARSLWIRGGRSMGDSSTTPPHR